MQSRPGGLKRRVERCAAALALATAILLPAPAAAEAVAPLAQEVVISAEDYAKLLGAYGQVGPLTTERDALASSLANMTEQRDLLTERVRLKEAIAEDYRELAEIRKLRAEEAEKRGDRIAKEKRRDGFWHLVKERALEGGLLGGIGGTAVPGVGNVAGALGGAAVGAIVGAIESFVGGP